MFVNITYSVAHVQLCFKLFLFIITIIIIYYYYFLFYDDDDDDDDDDVSFLPAMVAAN